MDKEKDWDWKRLGQTPSIPLRIIRDHPELFGKVTRRITEGVTFEEAMKNRDVYHMFDISKSFNIIMLIS